MKTKLFFVVSLLAITSCNKVEPIGGDNPVSFNVVILDNENNNALTSDVNVYFVENGNEIKFDRYQIVELKIDNDMKKPSPKYGGVALSINPNLGVKYFIKNHKLLLGTFTCDGRRPSDVIFDSQKVDVKIDSTVFPFVQILNLQQ